MNRKISRILALILAASISFNIAGCSAVEDFLNLDHDASEERDVDDEDDDEDEEEEEEESRDKDSETEETHETEETSSASEDGDLEELTYPDHIAAYDELHPEHEHGDVSGQEAQNLLNDIETELLNHYLGGSYVYASIFFEDPEAFGIEVENVGWGEVSTDTAEDDEFYAEILDELYSIDPDSLDDGDRIFYDKLLYDVELTVYALQYTAFNYYESALKELTGPQSEVLFILDVLEFTSVEDAENYIEVLRDIDRYYDGLCAFEEERVSYGYVNTDDVYENVALSFDSLVAQSEDCFLYESFRTRLDEIDGLSDEDRERLISEHDEVMHDVVFPEFEECAERIRALKCGAEEKGVSDYPGGDAYYAYLFAVQTNSGRTIEESIEQLESYTESIMQSMQYVTYSGDTSWVDEYLDHNYSMGDTADNLGYLYGEIQDDFPVIPSHSYRLMTVPEVFSDSFSPAAYLGYHLDDYNSNLILTNESQITSTFGVTCAHEGYPGHMYESLYHRSVCDHPYMYLCDSVGYSEGWATYVENYAFKYFSTSTASELVRIENQLNVILFARFDLGVNYEGWDAQDCADWYSDLVGVTVSADDIASSYSLLLSDPGYGIKYGLGFINTGMVMSQLREEFPEASDLEIHAAYLNACAGNFEQILENARQELTEGVTLPSGQWPDYSEIAGNEATESSDNAEEEAEETSETTSGGHLLGAA